MYSIIRQRSSHLSRLAHRSLRPVPTFGIRFQATAAAQPDGPAISETNRAQATWKRFWKTVGIEHKTNGITVTLDKRPLKTPSGNVLLLPENQKIVAALIATEWENQESLIKPHALPMTSLASRAIDSLGDETTRAAVRASLLKYFDTDTICFHEDFPDPLIRLQDEHWIPLINWVKSEFGVEINIFKGVLFGSQPNASKEKLDQVMSKFDAWEMAALERATYTTKSLLVALALVKRHLTVEQAALAAQVEVNSQIERWGEVEDTHDVDYHDVRRQLGSVACLLSRV